MEKLVRDNIPDIIQKESGKRPTTRTASNAEFEDFLHNKLEEEVAEFRDDPCVEELADVVEVLDELMAYYGIDKAMLAHVKERKANKKGRFKSRFIMSY